MAVLGPAPPRSCFTGAEPSLPANGDDWMARKVARGGSAAPSPGEGRRDRARPPGGILDDPTATKRLARRGFHGSSVPHALVNQ